MRAGMGPAPPDLRLTDEQGAAEGGQGCGDAQRPTILPEQRRQLREDTTIPRDKEVGIVLDCTREVNCIGSAEIVLPAQAAGSFTDHSIDLNQDDTGGIKRRVRGMWIEERARIARSVE